MSTALRFLLVADVRRHLATDYQIKWLARFLFDIEEIARKIVVCSAVNYNFSD